MAEAPGHMYARLAEAVARAGSPRSVYSQDTTLSRRGLLTRADRRARELQAVGVRAGDIVVLSMGNVVEFLVLLLAVSKLRAVAMPIDPSNGDRPLLDATERLPIRAVVRRPRGLETSALDYPAAYVVKSRRRLASSLLTVDALEPPAAVADVAVPRDAELVLEARGIGGIVRDTFRNAEQLRDIGEAAVACLGLDPGARLLCAQPYTVPRFFHPAVLGWLASEAQLVMAEGPDLQTVLPIAGSSENLVVFDSVRQFTALSRALKAAGSTLELQPVIPQSMIPVSWGRDMQQTFGHAPRQLLLLEELGIIAVRTMERAARFEPAPGVEFEAGATMQVGGHEVLVRTDQIGTTWPETPAGEPGTKASEHGYLHTGYAGKFNKHGELAEVLGRDDGLVNLEGRRACLDNIEDVMLTHRRVTWVRAAMQRSPDGDPEVHLEYEATGETPVDDIEEHAIGSLPPFMVPRAFVRVSDSRATSEPRR